MSRIPIRISLDSANVPMLSYQSGPTVVYVKEGMAKLRQEVKATEAPWELTEPQLIFAENVMPIPRGLNSVTYSSKVAGISGATKFSKAGVYRTSTNAVGYWAVTTDGKLYTSPVTGVSWTERTLPGWPVNWEITTAKINGSTYFYVSFYGCYRFNPDGTITSITLTGLTTTSIKGIAAAIGRLFAYTSTFLHYCSEVDIFDFTPSSITGAGSTQIQYVRGDILMMDSTSFGLFIYSKENVVACQETGNVAAPYLFSEVENSAGISDLELVASAPGLDAVYAFGSGGLQLVGVKQAVPIFPEISDFVALRSFESYDYVLHKIVKQTFISRMKVKLAYVASRYLVVSYGITSLTHMLVYDTALRRWGKLARQHVDVFTISEALTAGGYIEFDDMAVAANSVIISAAETKIQTAAFLSNQETFAVMGADGSIEVVDFNFVGAPALQAVCVFGRIQLRRGRDSSLHEVFLEGLTAAATPWVGDSVGYKGASFSEPVELYRDSFDEASYTSCYYGDAVGLNHNLHVEGMFDLTGLTVTLVPDGVSS